MTTKSSRGTEDVKKKNAMSGESIITASFRTTSCAPAIGESSSLHVLEILLRTNVKGKIVCHLCLYPAGRLTI